MTDQIDLQKYYRMPGIYVPLPTRGKFLPEGSCKLNEKGEVAIYPMRLADEMMLKNPDALMSGNAIESLFESCVPGISTPSLISSPDVDVLLLGIRVASVGRQMEMEATCPECGKECAFICDLPEMLARVKEVDLDSIVRISDEVTVEIRPYTVANMGFVGQKIFEYQRQLQALDLNDGLPTEIAQQQRTIIYKAISQLQDDMLAKTVVSVNTPEGSVTDPEKIRMFLFNVASQVNKAIEARQQSVTAAAMDKNLEIECEYCKHKWSTEIDFDPTNFFAENSSD